MKRHKHSIMARMYLIILAVLPFFYSCKKDNSSAEKFKVTVYNPQPVVKSNTMHVYTHYMPWFEDKTTSGTGKWGWHWTMNNQNPDIVDANGKRQIASHFYPKIGPYASSDPDLIEYHLLLMKYSGIEGVLIDWYGSSDAVDYGTNRRNTEALIAMLDKVGLKFAIVYEDATIPSVMQETGSDNAVSLARADMLYMQQNYFNRNSYIKIDGKPLLLVFGPSYFTSASDWTNIMSVFSTKPCFIPLYGHSSSTGSNSSGEFIWVDLANIDDKYATKNNFSYFIGGAWPGFHDFYSEGNAGSNLFTIDYNNGATLSDLLTKASDNNMDYLQLITWNDFGEGTMIEPTDEFGYTMLEEVQSFTGVSYGVNELQSIYDLFNLRKELKQNPDARLHLDQAFYYFVSLQQGKAMSIVDSLKAGN